jgi:hypothetical protein
MEKISGSPNHFLRRKWLMPTTPAILNSKMKINNRRDTGNRGNNLIDL